MRNSFNGFYGTPEQTIGNVFKSQDTIFIFDTNILLTLYRCEEETRDQFFAIWKKVKEQCWFPHHVCLEYQRNRLTVVKGSRDSLSAIYKKINSTITDLKKDIYGDTYNKTISRYTNLSGELESFFADVDRLVASFGEESIDVRNKKIDFFSSHDIIRDQIDELTDGRIGPGPENQAAINAINALGKSRYKYNIGPGFEDAKDKKTDFYSYDNIFYDGEYGDYYVWNQILEYVEKESIKNVVYVTNDAKSDFFFKIDGKVRGPNESLITEMKSKGASEFILQNINTFLHHANTHLNAKIDDATISELTNASPLSNKAKSLIKKLTMQNSENISKIFFDAYNIKKHSDLLHEEYSQTESLLNLSLRHLDILNGISTENLNQKQLDTLESTKKSMLSNIEKERRRLVRLENEIVGQNDSPFLDPDDVNDSDLSND
ncbi:hypothetical protein IV493_07140 [Pantoea sp. SM3640]|uniref:PIN-like domain-containing protein n=1 Tax=Pantoea sp. SM3640 TaxID=2787629 RepID=UPI0018A6E30F|nr:PIN-like domain-containing protein [Pantoea sp. SM3640]QPG28582.1 hypothetical protein IV493_07140 [Pantoea sp. SM3640]